MRVTEFKYVRAHGILMDENGVYTEDEHGNAVYNFSYVDQIYDGLLKNGVKPVVEISFMPKKLAFNPDALHPFWYKQNVSPPKSLERMGCADDGVCEAPGGAVRDRTRWRRGTSRCGTSRTLISGAAFREIRATSSCMSTRRRDLKAVSPRLRVGGPATAAAQWVDIFLRT